MRLPKAFQIPTKAVGILTIALLALRISSTEGDGVHAASSMPSGGLSRILTTAPYTPEDSVASPRMFNLQGFLQTGPNQYHLWPGISDHSTQTDSLAHCTSVDGLVWSEPQ